MNEKAKLHHENKTPFLEREYEYNGRKGFKLKPFFYMCPDFLGAQRRVIGMVLEDKNDPSYYYQITVGFGEFIGTMALSYIDINPMHGNAEMPKFLEENDIACDTGFNKVSDFLTYPCFSFNPSLVKEMENWKDYINDFNFYDEEEFDAGEIIEVGINCWNERFFENDNTK